MQGQTIGNYHVTDVLGEGGMGAVYVAEHPGLGRKAAIKVLHPQLARDPEVVSRFFNEARATNAIRHPNIVDIYDFGTLSDGRSYIVMELLEGETLASRLEKTPRLPVRQALELACQAAAALAAAHGKQIVHRDLKPDNLFVIPDPRSPGSEQVKILDFGIAKLARTAESASHKTRTGALIGTPLYMSPEQCLGVREVDHRTDIYSLGCILFEMLCGRPPFLSEGIGALINMHINQPPPAPRSLAPNLSVELERVMLKMLAKEPDDRFASMSDLLGELLPLLARAPDAPSPVPLVYLSLARPGRLPESVSAATTLSASAAATRTGADQPVNSRRRIALGIGLGLAAAGVVGFFALRPARNTAVRGAPTSVPAPAPPPRPAPPATTPQAQRAQPAPAPARDPAPAEIAISSVPEGATVSVGRVVIGQTPTVWKTQLTGSPVPVTFTLDGYRREVVHVLPAPGLTLNPTLSKSPRSHKAASSPKPPLPSDIKFER